MEIKDIILTISVVGNIVGQCIPLYMKRFDVKTQERRERREKILHLIEQIMFKIDRALEGVADHNHRLSKNLPTEDGFSWSGLREVDGQTSMLVSHCSANGIDASDFKYAFLELKVNAPKKYLETEEDILDKIIASRENMEKAPGDLIKRVYENLGYVLIHSCSLIKSGKKIK